MPTPDPSEPLPTMARQDAQDWAQELTTYLAQTAGVELTPSSIHPSFANCVGRHDEVVYDGRYTLSYAVTSAVPTAQHPEAVRKIRSALEQRGFEIKGYRETYDNQPAALLDAQHTEGRYLVSVETGGGTDRLLFRVNTRCLMAPKATVTPS